MTPTTVGLDLAKNVFHVHVADATGRAIESKRLTRRELLPFFKALPPCLIGIEACATAHNWAPTVIGDWPRRAPHPSKLCQTLRAPRCEE